MGARHHKSITAGSERLVVSSELTKHCCNTGIAESKTVPLHHLRKAPHEAHHHHLLHRRHGLAGLQ